MSILKTALDSIETLLTDNTSESALAQAADARIKIANAMSVEPVLYQRRMQADWHTGGNWTAWDDCSEATFKQVLIVPSLHGWTHEARALYLHPPKQAKQVPMTNEEVLTLVPGLVDCLCDPYDKQISGDDYSSVPIDMLRLARAIEAHHGIGGEA